MNELVETRVCEERKKNVNRRLDEIDKRLNKLDDIYKSINELTMSVREVVQEIKYIREEQTKLDNRVSTIEARPAKKWDQAVNYIITGILGAILAFLFAKIGLK